MPCQAVNIYLEKAKGFPFFYVVGDTHYRRVLDALEAKGVKVKRMSDFCPSSDRFPSIDDLIDYFRTSDVDFRENKHVVVGLGEYLALRGNAFAQKELSRLKSVTLGNARVVLLLRGVASQARELIRSDLRMTGQNRAHIASGTKTNISLVNIVPELKAAKQTGIKPLLRELEDGKQGQFQVSTDLSFDKSLFTTQTLSSPFEVVSWLLKEGPLEMTLGSEEEWKQLLRDLIDGSKEELAESSRNLNEVFSKHQISSNLTRETSLDVPEFQYKDWLNFLYLKLHTEQIQNTYLKRVVEDSYCFDDYRAKLTKKILEIPRDDPNFMELYHDRKKLLEKFGDADIADFVHSNGIDSPESIYRLTDNTMSEKQAVVKWIAKWVDSGAEGIDGIPEALDYVYPALVHYLKKYYFNIPRCPKLSEELTDYFDSYKRLKVTNRLTDDFLQRVEKAARERSYASLPTRENAISAITEKGKAHLYWIDALGVEYLSYLAKLAEKKGLNIFIDIVRVDTPTITEQNRSFYDNWPSGRKDKVAELDKIKHNNYPSSSSTDKDPIHIPAELEVIKKAVDAAVGKLNGNKCQKFIIASDHGASRLAVIKNPPVFYNADTKGERHGRCCPVFEGNAFPNTIEDNGYIVLCDYSRFSGGRAADVEVHGGASLEEIIVPVITLTLKNERQEFELRNGDEIFAGKRGGVTLRIFISYASSPDKVHLRIDGTRYPGVRDEHDSTCYTFQLSDVKRARQVPYKAELWDGDNHIGEIVFTVKSRTGKMNDDFDFDI